MAKTYDRQTAKFLAVVGENMPELSGDVMQGWIQNPKALQKILAKVLCPKSEPESIHELNIWKTIRLGTGLKTADDFRRALKDGGFKIGEWANDILGKSAFEASISRVLVEVDLCVATTAELTGKAEGVTIEEVFAGIKRAGGVLCSAEFGPQLRRQYLDQTNGEWLLIAMEPIADSVGGPSVFRVKRRGSALWLDAGWFGPGSVWSPAHQWVFVRPRK